jgi:PAS domain S-box-containing protein
MAELARIFGDILDQTPDTGLIVMDPSGRIVQWLGAARLIFGYTADEAVGQHGEILFTLEDRQRGMVELELQEALRTPRAEDDRWHLRKDGARVWISGSAIGLRDSAGQPYAVAKIVRDFTDRRIYVEALEQRLVERERVSAYKEVSVATLAHELRNPLDPLSNAVRMIRMAAPSRQSLDVPIAIIERQIATLSRLVEDLLDAGRVSAGTMRLQMTPDVELNALLAGLAEGLRPQFEGRRITLEFLSPEAPIHVEADCERLSQAITNLLTNAMKYTPAGGTVWLKSTVEEKRAVVRVQDTGVGLSADVLPCLFKLFTRGHEAAKMAPEGMGIGLSVVKQIVALHNGTLDVRSEGVGKGAEFSLHLPFRQPQPVEAGS